MRWLNFNINGERIERVQNYCQIGSKITEDGKTTLNTQRVGLRVKDKNLKKKKTKTTYYPRTVWDLTLENILFENIRTVCDINGCESWTVSAAAEKKSVRNMVLPKDARDFAM